VLDVRAPAVRVPERVAAIPSAAPVAAFALSTSILCLQLPTVIDGGAIVLVSFVPLAFAAYLSVLQRRTVSVPVAVWAVALVVTIVALSLLRAGAQTPYAVNGGAAVEALRWLAFVGLAALILLLAAPGWERRMCVMAVTIAPALYVGINVLLYLAGLENPAFPSGVYAQAKMLSIVGIDHERVVFPLASGLNNFGNIAAVALGSTVVLALRSQGRTRLVYGVLVAVSASAVLLTDARAAFVAPIVAVVAVMLAPVLAARLAPWFVLAALPLATAAIKVGESLGLSDLLARDRVAGAAASSDRTIIWSQAIEFFSHPSADFLLGYGAYGHVTTGVSNQYAYLFTGAARFEKTTHSFALQALLDLGIVGLAVAVVVLGAVALKLARRLEHGGSERHAALLAMLLTLVLLGATESTPMIYAPEALAAFLLVLLVAATIRTRGEPA
jgi:O-antigen ligase